MKILTNGLLIKDIDRAAFTGLSNTLPSTYLHLSQDVIVTLDPNAVIAKEKLTEYLLVSLPKDDKSRYLALAGYTLEKWQQLERDLREQILSLEAISTTKTRYGQKYAIVGNLTGVNGISIRVKTIWIVSGGITRFVTLFPA